MKKTILTGLQPTGALTLGNLIGSINQMKKYQGDYNSYILIVDLHAITVPQDPEELAKNIRSLIALYIACGLDPKQNKIFLQSENEYHANVSWLLECNTYFGELSRMTQFKDKSKKGENYSCGLLTYPVLMAADILIYDPDFIPVGQDQKQHVELARDIAVRFNNKFGDTFKVPEPLLPTIGAKIMDLVDPTKKMSKSEDNRKGVIELLEDPDSIRKKIMSATTDSDMEVKFDPENKPGISNLITILSSLSGKSIEKIENECKEMNYGEFKAMVADVVVSEITKIQTRYNELLNSKELDDILDEGRDYSRKIAKEKFDLLKQKLGLYR